jgi:uncharacterized protein YwgA
MNRYQLAKIVEWAGTLRTRKAMQKVVYLLQAAGCPLEVKFNLHHYGPYSPEVAQITDQLTREGLFLEKEIPNAAGKQFNYELTASARENLAKFEATPQGKSCAEAIQDFEKLTKDLVARDVPELEMAATVAYFRRVEVPWPEAIQKTREFKGLPPDSALMRRAAELAKRVVADEP